MPLSLIRRSAPCLAVLAAIVGSPVQTARAEEVRSRILVLPLSGPRGMDARDAIGERLDDRAWVKLLEDDDAEQPARAARINKATAMVGGAVTCRGRSCKVELVVYRRSGRIWSKATKSAPPAGVSAAAADLAVRVLDDVGALTSKTARVQEPASDEMDFSMESPEEAPEKRPAEKRPAEKRPAEKRPAEKRVVEEDEEAEEREDIEEEQEEHVSEEDFEFDNYEDESDRGGGSSSSGSGRRSRIARRYKALEVFVNADFTMLRNLCVDMAPELENDTVCSTRNPGDDDRTYTTTPFANMGGRLVVFPGAFFSRRAWWSHFGVYFDYGHSLVLDTVREYSREQIPSEENPNPPDESFTQPIDTSQQDFRVGVAGRLPLGGPVRPQLRGLIGVSYYEYYLDDSDYPPRVNEAENWRLTVSHQRTTPYLPAFSYTSFDIAVEFRYPFLDGMLWPYVSVAYRAGMHAGQADDVLGTDSTIHGVDGEIGLHVELPYGIRLYGAAELIWYGVYFDGESPDLPVGHLWGDTPPGGFSRDIILRLRVGAGWSF